MVVRSPPYDWAYDWPRTEGGRARVNSLGGEPPASSQNGHVRFQILSDGGIAEVIRGVGVQFRPPSRNGILTISSNPDYDSSYWNGGLFHGAACSAWIGLAVDGYTASDNFYTGALVRQREMLYNRNNAWWIGHEIHRDSRPGFPLNAQFRVDSSHWYAIWVLCGGSARSAGNGWSFSGANLFLDVPSIILSYAGIV